MTYKIKYPVSLHHPVHITRLVYVCGIWTFDRVMLRHTCDRTQSYALHVWCMCVAYEHLTESCYVTYVTGLSHTHHTSGVCVWHMNIWQSHVMSHMWQDSVIRITCLVYVCDIWTFDRVMLRHICDRTQSYALHIWCMCVTYEHLSESCYVTYVTGLSHTHYTSGVCVWHMTIGQCHVTSNMWQDSVIRITRLVYVCDIWPFDRVMLLHIRDRTQSYGWHVSRICVTFERVPESCYT